MPICRYYATLPGNTRNTLWINRPYHYRYSCHDAGLHIMSCTKPHALQVRASSAPCDLLWNQCDRGDDTTATLPDFRSYRTNIHRFQIWSFQIWEVFLQMLGIWPVQTRGEAMQSQARGPGMPLAQSSRPLFMPQRFQLGQRGEMPQGVDLNLDAWMIHDTIWSKHGWNIPELNGAFNGTSLFYHILYRVFQCHAWLPDSVLFARFWFWHWALWAWMILQEWMCLDQFSPCFRSIYYIIIMMIIIM